jgi:hypothetical protein
VGPESGLNVLVKKQIFCPCRDSNPTLSGPQLVAIPTALHDNILRHVLKQCGMNDLFKFTIFITTGKAEITSFSL